MYQATDTRQLKMENFYLPFGGHLNQRNRWVQLSRLIPWKEFEEKYSDNFSEDNGAPAKPFRMALGALIIKEKLNITDRETVDQIRENPYLQYLIGMESYRDEAPFDASLMVHFRKRITEEMVSEINDRIHKEQVKKNEKLMKKLKRKKRLK
jgi:transposase, IS5 family